MEGSFAEVDLETSTMPHPRDLIDRVAPTGSQTGVPKNPIKPYGVVHTNSVAQAPTGP